MSKASEEDVYQATILTTDGAVGSFIQGIIRENENISLACLNYMVRGYYGIESKPQDFFIIFAVNNR